MGFHSAADELQVSDFFADRVNQSEAMSESVLSVHRNLSRDTPDVGVRDNVLTFYGISGIGKSELSLKLEQWITGTTFDESEWQAAPYLGGRKVITTRWSVGDRHRTVDRMSLIQSLRTALGHHRKSWPGFDLAYTELHRAVRQSEPLTFGSNVDTATILEAAIADVGGALDIVGSSGLASVATTVFGVSAKRVADKLAKSKAGRIHHRYSELLVNCRTLATTAHQPVVLYRDLVLTITEQILALPPAERPLLIVFVDPFEKVQGGGAESAEDFISTMAAALPLCLFVITGRNRVAWHQPESRGLAAYDDHRWVSLSADVGHEPRQHALGFLSPNDATWLFKRFRDAERLPLDDELIADLVTTAQGWPIHIDTIASMARSKVANGATRLTTADLGGALPDLVNNLLEDLPDDEAKAFRSACLTSSFDTEFAARVAGVDEAAVLRLCRRAIVGANHGGILPFSIHDKLREIMHDARPPEATYGWTDFDWRSAAQRGLEIAIDLFDTAHEIDDGPAMIRNQALAFNIMLRYDVYDRRMESVLARGPSIARMFSLVDAPSAHAANPRVAEIYEFVAARLGTDPDDSEARLRALYEKNSSISWRAGQWLAYRVRNQGRTDEALALFDELLERKLGHASVLQNQRVVTLSMGRRFIDALANAHRLSEKQRQRSADSIKEWTGELNDRHLHSSEDRIASTTSLRFRLELISALQLRKARRGTIDLLELEELIDEIRRNGESSHLPPALTALGLTRPLGESVDDLIAEINECNWLAASRRGSASHGGAAEILAVRMLARGDTADIERVIQASAIGPTAYRARSWIPAEVYMEHLGHPLTPMPAQWPIPYDTVRQNWLAVGRSIADRIRA